MPTDPGEHQMDDIDHLGRGYRGIPSRVIRFRETGQRSGQPHDSLVGPDVVDPDAVETDAVDHEVAACDADATADRNTAGSMSQLPPAKMWAR